jgi:hypothetical protein
VAENTLHYVWLRRLRPDVPIYDAVIDSSIEQLKVKRKAVTRDRLKRRSNAPQDVNVKNADTSTVDKLDYASNFRIFWDNVRPMLRATAILGEMTSLLVDMSASMELETFLDNKATRLGANRQNHKVYAIHEHDLPKYYSIIAKRNDLFKASSGLPQMLLPTIISHFDAFLAGLLATTYETRPELIKSIDKQITVHELMQFQSINEAKQHYVEKEIDAFMYMSRSDQLKWLEKKFKVNIAPEGTLAHTFYEATERRNLVVHNNSVVNKRYLDNLRALDVPTTHKVGDRLQTTRKYLDTVISAAIELAFKVSQTVWRKIDKLSAAAADETANDVTFALIEIRRYELGRKLFEFCQHPDFRFAKERARLVNIVNYANLERLSGNQNEARRILEAEEWDSKNLEFQICSAAVLGEVDRCISLLERHGIEIGIGPAEYSSWPVFSEIRESPEFRLAHKKVLGVDILQPPADNE